MVPAMQEARTGRLSLLMIMKTRKILLRILCGRMRPSAVGKTPCRIMPEAAIYVTARETAFPFFRTHHV